MKEVKPEHGFLTPAVANVEDMTQPMGPLEEGDQALVDVVREIPEGAISTDRQDGTSARVNKSKTLGEEVVYAHMSPPHGSTEQTTTAHIRSMPGIFGRISAGTHDLPVDKHKHASDRAVTYVSGNEVHKIGKSILDMKPDRAKAQAIKLDAARRIKIAHEHIEKPGNDSQLAKESANS